MVRRILWSVSCHPSIRWDRRRDSRGPFPLFGFRGCQLCFRQSNWVSICGLILNKECWEDSWEGPSLWVGTNCESSWKARLLWSWLPSYFSSSRWKRHKKFNPVWFSSTCYQYDLSMIVVDGASSSKPAVSSFVRKCSLGFKLDNWTSNVAHAVFSKKM